MAYVKILWNRNVVALENYMFGSRDIAEPIEMFGCVEGLVSEQFIGTQVHFGDMSGLNAIHIVQSFSPDDSLKLSPEEFTMIGRQLIESQFPGHQFCVVLHTDTDQVHNHIMVNPVHLDDGSRINNKTRHLYDLRARSDDLCREQGLTIIEAQSQERWKNTPEEVREIKRRGGFSWVLDLKEKADFARSIATSFDEYAGVLNQFGIQVRVEDKNVIYHYPDKRQKRGDTRGLGEKYSIEGLVEKFRENYDHFYRAGLKLTPPEKVNFQEHWKFHRESAEYFVPPYRYKDLVVPQSLFKMVQGIDLEKQASELGIELFNQDGGKKFLRDRDHIQIDRHQWVNEKNGTRGGALEFLNYHHEESWLKTLRRFDTTGKVERVLSVADEVRPTFRAFYVPRQKRGMESKTKPQSLEALGIKLSSIERLLSARQVELFSNGKLKLRASRNPKVALTLHRKGVSWVCRNSSGVGGAFFKNLSGPKDRLLVFEDPMAFLGSGRFLDRLAKNKIPVNVYVPLQPIDQFLKGKREVLKKFPKVTLVRSKEKLGWGRDEDLKIVTDREIREAGDDLGLAYQSIDELLRDLILGRSR